MRMLHDGVAGAVCQRQNQRVRLCEPVNEFEQPSFGFLNGSWLIHEVAHGEIACNHSLHLGQDLGTRGNQLRDAIGFGMHLPLVIQDGLEEMYRRQIFFPNSLLIALVRSEKACDIWSFTKTCDSLLKLGKMGLANSFDVRRAKMQKYAIHRPLEGHPGILPLIAKIDGSFDKRGKNCLGAEKREKWLQSKMMGGNQPVPIHECIPIQREKDEVMT